ncbi:MAG TPA: glycosyltransferase N-terminal domain-containing protein, partial [Candidatus Cloacimonadota bacterium]|nr:glycosyltransferase N-terminal domain-containing protein [Candidatus Cloacimonadota bacterium]
SACHAEGREFESRRSRHFSDAAFGVHFLLMMTKILLIAFFYLYRLIIELVYFFIYPLLWIYLGSKNYREALSSSFTKADILIHASSLGEINALVSLIRELSQRGHSLAIHTITVTGRERAKSLFLNLPIRLAPLDIPHLRERQMDRCGAKLVLIAETEIWPNMLYASAKHKVPVIFINARISPRTLKSFTMLSPLLGLLASSVKGILAQSMADAERFNQLFPSKAIYSGNLKFALELPDYSVNDVKREWYYTPDDQIICWGSSRPGEEELILSIFQSLKAAHSKLKLILAPRHPKRVKEIVALMAEQEYSLLSELKNSSEILIIDSLGMLAKCYAICDLAIIGGSFYDFGGHNPLEAAYYAKPVIIGNHHSSCRDSVELLRQQRGILVSSKETLEEDIRLILHDKELAREMGAAARLVLTENASALDNHIREIEKCLN